MDTPAGVASADGVAESCWGAGVADERDSSDPLEAEGIGVGLLWPLGAVGVGEDCGEARAAEGVIAVRMGVAGGRKLPLEEMRICGMFSAVPEGSFFNCCCIEIGVPVVCGIPRAFCCCWASCCWCCCIATA